MLKCNVSVSVTTVSTYDSAVAEKIFTVAEEAIRIRDEFIICLSGGSTPIPIYKLMATRFINKIPGNKIHVFWGDERAVPPSHPESNYLYGKENFIAPLQIPPENVHRMQGEMDPKESVDQYKNILREYGDVRNHGYWPRFDLTLLGLGEDGHTASLFPGQINDDQVTSPVIVANHEYQGRPALRLSLTPMVFNASRDVYFLVRGSAKANAVKNAILDDHSPTIYPSHQIQPLKGSVTWFIDEPAAIEIQSTGKKLE